MKLSIRVMMETERVRRFAVRPRETKENRAARLMSVVAVMFQGRNHLGGSADKLGPQLRNLMGRRQSHSGRTAGP